jgi:phosphoenolpyruvate-protein kinase (PTS system EI component)
MRTFVGAGCWPGRIEGRAFWINPEATVAPAQTQELDRASEVRRFRSAVTQAVTDLEAWSEQQLTVEGRLLLQGTQDALQLGSWNQRVCGLIDASGLGAPAAALEAALAVAGVMDRSPEHREQAESLRQAGRWMVWRLSPRAVPADAILVARDLSPWFLLHCQYPAVIGGAEPPVRGRTPLVWGVPDAAPHWHGRRIVLHNTAMTIDLSN